MSWFRNLLVVGGSTSSPRTEFETSPRTDIRSVRPDPSTGSGEGQIVARNDDITDPGIDVYIPPDAKSEKIPPLSPQALGPIGWVKQLLEKKQALETVRVIIAKVELLSRAPDNAIRYFFDNDLPALVSISQKYPQQVQQMLRESLAHSPTRKISEPWYRLVQVAAGDNSAILPALDGLL